MIQQMSGSILVVDDDELLRDAAVAILQAAGYSVTPVSSADAALQTLADASFDLVLLDIRMPGVDGLELLTQLRGSAEHAGQPVVMTSAVCDLESIERCIGLGIDGYLLKPVTPDLLLERIARALRARGKGAAPLATAG
ncbi:MAG TPA: response regulator [Longimicrobiaceae bacterium]|nr:response regulator [Longimicrobiaceae bacterium]